MNLKPKILAQAFWEMIWEKGDESVSHTLNGLRVFYNLYYLDQNAHDFFSHPRIALQEKSKIAQDFLSSLKMTETAQRFLALLLAKQQLQDLPVILAHLQRLRNHHFSVASVKVSFATLPSEGQRKELEEEVKKVTKATRIEWSETVDKTLLGGVVLRAEDNVWDASLRSKLKKVQKNLCST
ncbi:ATP synthase F1 subunit delta [Candidatus Peregrinibacteria bacterium]|nr:ATP synthase F1 subunit delta [Candidatus Peregrinibacteria bacterium]